MPSVHPSQLPPRLIQLTRGFVAKVDEVDHFRAESTKFCAVKRGRKTWAVHNRKIALEDGRRISVSVNLGEFIMDARPDQVVEHVNGDLLDARRANLRVVDRPNPKRTSLYYIDGRGRVQDSEFGARMRAERAAKTLVDPLDEPVQQA